MSLRNDLRSIAEDLAEEAARYRILALQYSQMENRPYSETFAGAMHSAISVYEVEYRDTALALFSRARAWGFLSDKQRRDFENPVNMKALDAISAALHHAADAADRVSKEHSPNTSEPLVTQPTPLASLYQLRADMRAWLDSHPADSVGHAHIANKVNTWMTRVCDTLARAGRSDLESECRADPGGVAPPPPPHVKDAEGWAFHHHAQRALARLGPVIERVENDQ